MVGSVNIYFSSSKLGPSWLYISWSHPSHIPKKYPVHNYEIGIHSLKECSNHWKQEDIQLTGLTNTTQQQYNITGLLPETCYVMFVRARTIQGYGPWSSGAFNTTSFNITTNRTISSNNVTNSSNNLSGNVEYNCSQREPLVQASSIRGCILSVVCLFSLQDYFCQYWGVSLL